MNDADGGLRQTARELLTQWEVEDATLAAQSLNDLQAGDDTRAREAAKWLAAHVIVDEELSPQVSAALVSLLANRNVRNDATGALRFWATAESVPALIEAASVAHAAEDRDTERACVMLLTGLNDERALRTYAAYLGTRHDRTVARAAFTAIGENGAKALLPFIHHPDSSVRQIAHDLLAEWEIEKSHWLTQSMKDLQAADENQRRQAVRYLIDTEPDESVKSAVALALIGMVDDQRLRHDALRALQTWATADTVPKLIELLDHEDRGVQSGARTILIATKDPRAVAPLAEGFGADFLKRIEARRALVAMGPVAETAFWPHVTHKDWRVAKDACEAWAKSARPRASQYCRRPCRRTPRSSRARPRTPSSASRKRNAKQVQCRRLPPTTRRTTARARCARGPTRPARTPSRRCTSSSRWARCGCARATASSCR